MECCRSLKTNDPRSIIHLQRRDCQRAARFSTSSPCPTWLTHQHTQPPEAKPTSNNFVDSGTGSSYNEKQQQHQPCRKQTLNTQARPNWSRKAAPAAKSSHPKRSVFGRRGLCVRLRTLIDRF